MEESVDSPRSARRQAKCSFCGKDQKEVTQMVAGPNVYMCGDCIELGLEVIMDYGYNIAEDMPLSMFMGVFGEAGKGADSVTIGDLCRLIFSVLRMDPPARETKEAEWAARQHGYEIVDPATVEIEHGVFSLFTSDFCWEHLVLPCRRKGNSLVVVVVNHPDKNIAAKLTTIAEVEGLLVQVALKSQLRDAITAALRGIREGRRVM
ncbi:MAG: hypothetical protein HQ530_03260 [Parcubacteria group bacterium]|nr:hypothetical protein [Parcubacteria group bacterium]